MSKQSILIVLFASVLLMLTACSPKNENSASSSSDTTTTDTVSEPEPDQEEESNEEEQAKMTSLIQYDGASNDEVTKALGTFSPFIPLHLAAEHYISLQDSFEYKYERWGEPLTDPKDTLFLLPFKKKAY